MSKEFWFFFAIYSDMQAAQLLIETDKSGKDMIKIILSKFVKPHPIRKK